jgi:hypothetical protein
VREHVDRAHDAIIDFRRDGISADGVLIKPVFQAASLKAAREELSSGLVWKTFQTGLTTPASFAKRSVEMCWHEHERAYRADRKRPTSGWLWKPESAT